MKEYLKKYAETTPSWLTKHKKGDSIDLKDVFNSHIVYYPGSGSDGQPVKSCVQSSCAHVFLYVDYGISRENLENELIHYGFSGYHIMDTIELFEKDLAPKGWQPHIVIEKNTKKGLPLIEEKPYSFMSVFERDKELTEEHGTDRFAIIFLFADGIASYDALFGNKNLPSPFMVVLQDHGSGGNYDNFGKDSLMEKIAISSDVFPQLLVVGENTKPWQGYSKIDCAKTHGGMHHNLRQLFKKNN